jgi:hypothetical protein
MALAGLSLQSPAPGVSSKDREGRLAAALRAATLAVGSSGDLFSAPFLLNTRPSASSIARAGFFHDAG